MNQRIQQLALQAGFTVVRAPGLKHTVPKAVFIANVCVSNEMQKFAELIVRDVVDTVKRTQHTSPDFEWAILNNYDLELNDESA